ncbi:YbaN family protein [Halotalea alkalilenta]|uniref:Inner membrane protein n=1 Tax=Halotalea alkalilenta TaxID=376489 RepID=A0A172YE90_9GAMM|nr:YbaN family protein [Halotalea alkalilenta]ANF57285.1 hypothetical protein A5892_07265 [Halotalea alkalilenta]
MPPARPRRLASLGYKIFGLCALGLAIIGAFLPVMPTVPFLLVAAWAFERGSPRLDAWLRQHPTFGPLLRDWRERGAIPRYAKLIAVVSMAASLVLMWFGGAPLLVVLAVGAILLAVSSYLLSRPSA